MSLATEYRSARRDEETARLRRSVALRAMSETGMSQRSIGAALGVSQPAISQQFTAMVDLTKVHPEMLLQAAAPVLTQIVEGKGFSRLAVFGSVARGQARVDSDIDLLVDAPHGTSIGDLVALTDLLHRVVGRSVDLVTYGGLKVGVDDDVLREAVLL